MRWALSGGYLIEGFSGFWVSRGTRFECKSTPIDERAVCNAGRWVWDLA